MNAKSKASCQASLTSTKCRDVWIECWCWWKNWKNWKSCFEEVCARHMNICTNVAVTKFQKSCQHTVLVQLRSYDVNVGFRFSPAFLILSFGSVKVWAEEWMCASHISYGDPTNEPLWDSTSENWICSQKCPIAPKGDPTNEPPWDSTTEKWIRSQKWVSAPTGDPTDDPPGIAQ